jgi:imidazolonepropionase-like amidohydrolase
LSPINLDYRARCDRSVGPADRIKVPEGAQRVDGTGKYLIPGLVDVHVHLASNPQDEQRHILKLFLANGVTTVVNLRGTPQILDLRAAVAKGQTLGPRIYTVGPYVNEDALLEQLVAAP